MAPYIFPFYQKHKTTILLFCMLGVILAAGLLGQQNFVRGDSPDYTDAIHMLQARSISVPHGANSPKRLVTAFGFLEILRFLSFITHDVYLTWITLNSIWFLLAGYFFFRFVLLLLDDRYAAFAATFLFAANYITITEGLSYMADMGGWFFFFLSFFLIASFWKTKSMRFLLLASVSIGIGGLFKEYGLLPYIALLASLAWSAYKDRGIFLKNFIVTGIISFAPTAVAWVYVYKVYHYSYLTNVASATELYATTYNSRILEFVKVYGSLYHFGWLLFAGGAILMFQNRKRIPKDLSLKLFLLFISALPLVFWPGITQRVVFITILPAIIISAYFLKETKRYWYAHVLFFVAYIVTNIYMKFYILPNVSIEGVYHTIRSLF